VPESPKWLLIKGRRADAITALNRIAVFNKSEYKIPEDAEFMECLVAQNMDPNQTLTLKHQSTPETNVS
jgi:hypothetical protein